MPEKTGQSLVCSLKGGGVSAGSPVNDSPFATSPLERLEILRKYRNIAMVGLSANIRRPSHFAAVYLKAKGYNVIPVNPAEKEILGRRCFASLGEIGESVDVVDIFRPAAEVPPLVEEAIAIGAKVVWMQLGVIHYEAAQRARDAGLEVVMDHCMKIEHGRFFGGLNLLGLSTGVISAKAWNPRSGMKS
jgi:predicted CoA-binding protein